MDYLSATYLKPSTPPPRKKGVFRGQLRSPKNSTKETPVIQWEEPQDAIMLFNFFIWRAENPPRADKSALIRINLRKAHQML
jgi:hypothetical protein